jgi:hypothetical protein
MPRLTVYRGRTQLFEHHLQGDDAVLGRSSDVSIPLDSPAVSRRHVRFFKKGAGWYVEDLRGKNPALLNQRPFTISRINHSDQIGIADHVIVFHYPRDEAEQDRALASGTAGAGFRINSTDIDAALQDSQEMHREDAVRSSLDSRQATMAVPAEKLAELMAQVGKRQGAMLVLVAEGARQEFALTGKAQAIGFEDGVEIRLPGRRLFARRAAEIAPLSNGRHTVRSLHKWVTVKVGENPVSDSVLADKDVVTIEHAFGFGRSRLRYEAAIKIAPKSPAKKSAPAGNTQIGPGKR